MTDQQCIAICAAIICCGGDLVTPDFAARKARDIFEMYNMKRGSPSGGMDGNEDDHASMVISVDTPV